MTKDENGQGRYAMKRLKLLFSIFISVLKVGLFTFGGGYAMISVIEHEFVSKKKWIEHEEFLDLVAIAESTPGPIAINSATYIGYKKSGFFGALVATIGMCLPSFVIIFLISLFFDAFLSIAWVAAAIKGIQACVVYLIAAAGFKMWKKMKKTTFNTTLFFAVVGTMVALSLFSVSFSSIFYILIAGTLGVALFGFKQLKEKKNKGGKQA